MYAATVDSQHLTFVVAGFWRRNMIMRDRETGSIWQQATGEAIAGPQRGQRLGSLGGEVTTWAAWQAEYPQTALAVEPPTAPRGLVRWLPFQPMLDWYDRLSFTPPGLTPPDPRLPSRAEVAGLVVSGESRAYPLSVLRQIRVVNDRVRDVPVAVIYDPHGDRIRAFRRTVRGRTVSLAVHDGDLTNASQTMRWNPRGEPIGEEPGEPLRPLPVSRQWWLAWSEFHPDTSIYQP